MRISEYLTYDATGLGELVQKGDVTPLELMQCATTLAEKWNKKLNFMALERYDDALGRAATWKNRGAFQGLPFLLKDADLACYRLPVSVGSKLFNGLEYQANATLVNRFEDAGLIPFGRTTVPELCMGPTTEAIHNGGPTRNPWAPAKSAGGSSGGSAVAVALGVVPIAHGNDGGGSIRIPASCNGIFGLKPSRGLVPMGPFQGEGWAGLSSEGVLSCSVRDTARILDAVCGDEQGAPYAAPRSSVSYSQSVQDLAGPPLKVAVWRQAWETGLPVASICQAAVDHIISVLRDLGHQVEEKQPPIIDFDAYTHAQAQVVAASLASAVGARLKSLERTLLPNDLEPATRQAYEIGQTVTAIEYVSAVRRFHALGRTLAQSMDGFDLVLTPALTQPPLSLGELDMNRDFWTFRKQLSEYAPFISVCNASGQPAASVPSIRAESGEPIGVQLIAQLGRDDLVLKVAAQIEKVAPWRADLNTLHQSL